MKNAVNQLSLKVLRFVGAVHLGASFSRMVTKICTVYKQIIKRCWTFTIYAMRCDKLS